MSREQIVEKLGGSPLGDLIPTCFRRDFGLSAPGQYGMVCADTAEERRALQSLGCSPFLHTTTPGPGWTEYGEPVSGVKVDMAMGYVGDEQIELLGPGQGTDFYREAIPESGALTLHHVCCFQNNIDEMLERLPQAGYPVALQGESKAGPVWTRFAYFDTRKDLGLFLEITQYRLFGRHFPPGRRMITSMAKLQQRFA
mgnify:CR=1 FL=1